jgi:hypothetical protein
VGLLDSIGAMKCFQWLSRQFKDVRETRQVTARSEARIQRMESMSFARHNPTATQGIAEAKKEIADLIVSRSASSNSPGA